MIFFWIPVGLVVWFVIGCAVLATIDRDERLFWWAVASPYGMCPIIVMAWPWVTAVYWFNRDAWRSAGHGAEND